MTYFAVIDKLTGDTLGVFLTRANALTVARANGARVTTFKD